MGALGDRLRNRQTIGIVVLAVLVTLLLGTIIGFIVGGGLDDETTTTTTAATTTTTAATTTTTASDTTGSIPPATAAGGELAIPATEDTYVNSFEPAEVNGAQDSLEVENDPPEVQRALVRFQVTGIPEGEIVSRAVLRLFVVEDTDSPVTVHLVDGDWSETETTWTTAPSVGAQVAVIEGGNPEGAIVELDVTGVVNGAGQVDFYLITASADTAGFASREAGSRGPTLVITLG